VDNNKVFFIGFWSADSLQGSWTPEVKNLVYKAVPA